MDFLSKFGTATWDIFLQMSPYLLLGFLFAGILNVVISKRRISKHLGKPGLWSSVKASLLGVPLPLCSCGVIPTGISFHKNGASKGATNSFLISTPQTGLDSILMTFSMMNIYWAIFRPIVAFITGVLGGFATDKLIKKEEPAMATVENEEEPHSNKPVLVRIFNYAFIDFLGDISRQLLLGIFLAVLITIFVPTSLFTEHLTYPLINMLIILVASIPLYVCATGSVPIAAALLVAGVSPGAVLVFLMAGPATNAATITVLWKSIGKKATLIYLGSIVFGALLFGILIDYVFEAQLFTTGITAADHVHGEGTEWIALISSFLLIGLIGFVELKKLIPNTYKKTQMNTIYNVEGMTCNHCKNSVEKNLMKVEGITAVTADPNQSLVVVEGDAISNSNIEEIITELGFTYKGEKE
ncbi:MAG: heavy metal-associated domain-containing protein [Crocinitomix sp.]|nr:heavy metal-associated domain-containing protein [Crocinitomix sp.]